MTHDTSPERTGEPIAGDPVAPDDRAEAGVPASGDADDEGAANDGGANGADADPRNASGAAGEAGDDERRADPLEAARGAVRQHWPDARAALLAGSAARGEAGPSSDLDLVVVLGESPDRGASRRSFEHDGWRVEAFVHSDDTLERRQQHDARRRRPSLSQMIAEGRVLRDRDGIASRLKQRATARLAAGPAALSEREVRDRRYRIADLLGDLLDASGEVRPLVAAELALRVAETALDLGGHWRGGSSWTARRLDALSPGAGAELSAALVAACRGDAEPLERFALEVLDPVGGPLFEGHEVHEFDAAAETEAHAADEAPAAGRPD